MSDDAQKTKCPACDGAGCPDYAGFAMDRCERCGGSGRLRDHVPDAGNMVRQSTGSPGWKSPRNPLMRLALRRLGWKT